jgi:hypothetical protein
LILRAPNAFVKIGKLRYKLETIMNKTTYIYINPLI